MPHIEVSELTFMCSVGEFSSINLNTGQWQVPSTRSATIAVLPKLSFFYKLDSQLQEPNLLQELQGG